MKNAGAVPFVCNTIDIYLHLLYHGIACEKSRTQKGNVSMSEHVNVCEYIESNCVRVEADCFDIEQIMESGQCFRIYKLSLQERKSFAKARVWRIVKA